MCSIAALGFNASTLENVNASETSDGSLRVEVITAYNFVVDSNVESPSTYAPRSAYIGAKIYNDGPTTLTDVAAYAGNQVAGTPGIYPSRAHPPLVGPLPGDEFALTHEGGSLGPGDAYRYLDSIEPGEHITVYWLVSYPNLDELGNAVWGPSIKPDDDLWLEYDIWATASESGTARLASVRRTATMRNEISAAANKIFPNGANKVPPEYLELLNQFVPSWSTAALDGSPGSQIVAEGVWYDFGNVGEGFDNDGDLVPDHNAWMQPVGDPELYDPGCFRLVHTYALVIVKLKSGGEQIYFEEDSLYFEHIPPNNGAVGWVGYEIFPIDGPCESLLTPYQEVASGRDNEKFNGDYGASVGTPIRSLDSDLEIGKIADVGITDPGGTIAYTISYTNNGFLVLGDPSVGAPVTLNDSIPAGTVYVAGSANAANTLPAGVAEYTVLFSTNNGTSFTSVEPLAADVTDLQWWLSDPMPTGTVGTVRFDVVVDSPYNATSPLIENIAGIGFAGTSIKEDEAITRLRGNNTLGDTVYSDTGAGSDFANGLIDGGESGIPDITVSLYYDVNTNQLLDTADVLFNTTETDAFGVYSFADLPDGTYIGVVDAFDVDMPFGFTPTSDEILFADLDTGGSNVNPVSDLDVDFGFAPVLDLDKTLLGSGPLYEGDTVTYTIDVFNRLPGNGTGQPNPNSFTTWGSNLDLDNSGTGNKEWTNSGNIALPGEPEGSFAQAPLANANETIAVNTYDIGVQPGSITNVQVVLRLSLSASYLAGDTLFLNLIDNVSATTFFATNYPISSLNSGDYFIDVTPARTWAWTDFASTNVSIQLLADKGSGNSPGVLDVDAAGFNISTDDASTAALPSETLQPVPLKDTYDASLLEFISSTPQEASMVVTGTPPMKWGL